MNGHNMVLICANNGPDIVQIIQHQEFTCIWHALLFSENLSHFKHLEDIVKLVKTWP